MNTVWSELHDCPFAIQYFAYAPPGIKKPKPKMCKKKILQMEFSFCAKGLHRLSVIRESRLHNSPRNTINPTYLWYCRILLRFSWFSDLQPAHNVTFLGATSYLAIEPFLGQKGRGFNIGLSFRVDHKTKNGLIFLETHSQDVSDSFQPSDSSLVFIIMQFEFFKATSKTQ